MYSYILRRLSYVALIWLGISLIAFLLGDVAPGDPLETLFQRQHGRPPSVLEIEALREELGLDRPAPERYVDWVAGALHGDLGASYTTGRPVTTELLTRLPATFELAGAGMVVALVIALPVGVVAALHRNRLLDQTVRVGAIFGASIPGFWLAFLLIMLFSVRLGLFPTAGYGTWRHVVLPALALGLGESAILARLVRSSLLDTLSQRYIVAAYAKGIPRYQVVVRHGLGNSLAAVLTEGAVTFGALFAHSVIIEVIFVRPGIGRLAYDAIIQRDYPVIQGFVLLAGTLFALINLVVDLGYLWLDPRLSYVRERPAVTTAW